MTSATTADKVDFSVGVVAQSSLQSREMLVRENVQEVLGCVDSLQGESNLPTSFRSEGC